MTTPQIIENGDELAGLCAHLRLADEVAALAEGNTDIGMRNCRLAADALARGADAVHRPAVRIGEISIARDCVRSALCFFENAGFERPGVSRTTLVDLHWSVVDIATSLLEPSKYEIAELGHDDLEIADEAVHLVVELRDILYPPSATPPLVAGTLGMLANCASAISVEALEAAERSKILESRMAQIKIAAKAAPIAERLYMALAAVDNARREAA